MTFNHITRAAFLLLMREKYKQSKDEECAKLAAWMDANCTDAELSTMFQIVDPKDLRKRMKDSKDKLDKIKSVVGE